LINRVTANQSLAVVLAVLSSHGAIVSYAGKAVQRMMG
jgi:hypothetical protein